MARVATSNASTTPESCSRARRCLGPRVTVSDEDADSGTLGRSARPIGPLGSWSERMTRQPVRWKHGPSSAVHASCWPSTRWDRRIALPTKRSDGRERTGADLIVLSVVEPRNVGSTRRTHASSRPGARPAHGRCADDRAPGAALGCPRDLADLGGRPGGVDPRRIRIGGRRHDRARFASADKSPAAHPRERLLGGREARDVRGRSSSRADTNGEPAREAGSPFWLRPMLTGRIATFMTPSGRSPNSRYASPMSVEREAVGEERASGRTVRSGPSPSAGASAPCRPGRAS